MLNHTPPNKIECFFEQIASTLENILLMLATRFGPWLAPIGPAYFVGRAAHTHLEAHWLIALAMALAVEAVGIAATHTALKAWAWNNVRRKTDPQAPTTLMVWLSLFYFAAALALSILVEVYPTSATYAPAVFIGLAAVAYVTIAVSLRLNQWMAARLAEISDRKALTSLKAEIAVQRKELEVLAKDVQQMAAQRDGLAAEHDDLVTERDRLFTECGLALSDIDELAMRSNLPDLAAQNGSSAAPEPSTTPTQMAADSIHSSISPISGTSITAAHNGRQARIAARRMRIKTYLMQGKTDAEIRTIEGISQDTLRRDKAVLAKQQPVQPEYSDQPNALHTSYTNGSTNGVGGES